MPNPEPGLPHLFEAVERNDPRAMDQLFSTLYSELRRLAKRELARQGSFSYLSPTTLLHEAYIEIADKDGSKFPDRGRFMGYAARVMRGLIIDHARSRSAQKRGGKFEITSVDGEIHCAPDPQELTKISDALDELAKSEAPLAEIVDLKFFLRIYFCRDRRDEAHFRAHGAAAMGKGQNLSSSRHVDGPGELTRVHVES